MPISCPRCSQALVARPHFVRADIDALELDACPGCQGLWLDGAEVPLMLAPLAHHAFRHGDLRIAGAVWGGSIGACPRCRAEVIAFPHFSRTLALCSECHGMWIDGPDVAAVLQGQGDGDGLPRPADRVAGYRTTGAVVPHSEERPAPDTMVCVRCGTIVDRRATLLTANGPICAICDADTDDLDAWWNDDREA
ncbi:MAG: zf-TFIIB domain-containing protein [Myxococcales bacterium]|nr:zf-TFIIB domain-containing protein [Myxococcales bacterium]